MTKVGVIGLGNMGQALIKAFLDKSVIKAEDLYAYDVIKEKRTDVKEGYGINILPTAEAVYEKSEYIILAIKPNDVPDLLNTIKDCREAALNEPKRWSVGKTLISVCAGISILEIEKLLSNHKIARVMPNTPYLVGEGACGVCFNDSIDKSDKKYILDLLRCAGMAFELSEELLNAVTGLSASGPAFVFMFIEALADGGVRAGLSRAIALSLAAQTVYGAAKLYLESNKTSKKHPGELKDMVSSPGGTTIEGISVLENGGFRGLVIESVFIAYKKACKLSNYNQDNI